MGRRNEWLRPLILLAACLVLLPAGVRADADRLGQVLEQIRQNSRANSSFRCRMVQVKRLKFFQEPVVFRGWISSSRELGVRLDFSEPVPSSVIITAEKLIRCSEEGRAETYPLSGNQAAQQIFQQVMTWFMFDTSALERRYSITLLDDSPTLEIIPADQAIRRYITGIRVRFGPEMNFPRSILIDEEGGDSTEIILSECSSGIDFDSALFKECRLPASSLQR